MDLLTSVLWLTLNVYHEARSEPDLGQIAVVHVTLNRSKSRQLPVKEVVLQPFQFSWTLKDSYLPDDWDAFGKSLAVVKTAMMTEDVTDGAIYYHHEKIIPEWTNRTTYTGQIGVHKFYK